ATGIPSLGRRRMPRKRIAFVAETRCEGAAIGWIGVVRDPALASTTSVARRALGYRRNVASNREELANPPEQLRGPRLDVGALARCRRAVRLARRLTLCDHSADERSELGRTVEHFLEGALIHSDERAGAGRAHCRGAALPGHERHLAEELAALESRELGRDLP